MNYRRVLALYICTSLFLLVFAIKPVDSVLADIPNNGLRQKIGFYDVQINTNPLVPVVGKRTNILVSISSSNPDFPLTDIPVVLIIMKDDSEIHKTDPIFLAGGHLNYPYVFREPGLYGLHIDFLNNSLDADSSTNQITTFEFPLKVSDSNSMYFTELPIIIILIVGSVTTYLAFKKRVNFFYRLKKRTV